MRRQKAPGLRVLLLASLAFLTLVLFFPPLVAHASSRYDPRLRFRTISTPRFDIHFHQGEEAQARRLATLAERVAADLDKTLSDYADIRFSAALSGLPLLSFPKPQRLKFIESVLDRMIPGKGLVQFSYSAHGPMSSIAGRFTATASKWVLMNLPPARVWTYRCA